MSDPSGSEDSAPETSGVFGNLPRSRPGTRSPRRDEGHRSSAPRTAATPEPASDPASEQRIAGEQAEGAPEPHAPAAEGGQSGGLEDLAWAGIAVAAEAATIGVRLASRAMEAVKDAGKRS
ncbi:MAG TPA: hypothetical protein VHJ54_11950 [Solirubrobacterales bacterium]|nr:hypothetical protein [Solirubrobacterales bacterium]